MSATIINLIIQIIAGAIGGNAVGAASKTSIGARSAIRSPAQSEALAAASYLLR